MGYTTPMKYEKPIELTEAGYLSLLRGDAVQGVGVRVCKTLAQKWMFENKGLICGGTVFFLEICNLGLGIYLVKKAPLTVRATKMVKNKPLHAPCF